MGSALVGVRGVAKEMVDAPPAEDVDPTDTVIQEVAHWEPAAKRDPELSGLQARSRAIAGICWPIDVALVFPGSFRLTGSLPED